MGLVCDAIIPARGGSKGVPRKNLRTVGGVPLVVRAIRAAQGCTQVRGVYVSTDDEEITAMAERNGASIIRRPDALSGDTASSESAILHALEAGAGSIPPPDVICFMQCTSPFTQASDIQGALETLAREKSDSLFTATRVHHFLWKRDPESMAGINHVHNERKRRQDRQAEFMENGAFYIFKREGFLAAKHRFFGKISVHEMPPNRSIEIDTEDDLIMSNIISNMDTIGGGSEKLNTNPAAIIFDFDGVFTDNLVSVKDDGQESVTCSRADGMGIENLRKTGIPLLILSKEQNPVVAARARKLQIEALQGVEDKLPALREWIADRNISIEDVIYVGNDINDIACMRAVGCAVAVADAYPEARQAAHVVLRNKGGHGAIRELADRILRETAAHNAQKR